MHVCLGCVLYFTRSFFTVSVRMHVHQPDKHILQPPVMPWLCVHMHAQNSVYLCLVNMHLLALPGNPAAETRTQRS